MSNLKSDFPESSRSPKDVACDRCVQPGGGLVEEQDRGLGYELEANVDTLALATADTTLLDTANNIMLYSSELEHGKRVLHDLATVIMLFVFGEGQAQLSCIS